MVGCGALRQPDFCSLEALLSEVLRVVVAPWRSSSGPWPHTAHGQKFCLSTVFYYLHNIAGVF
jgi:hypothetical protein